MYNSIKEHICIYIYINTVLVIILLYVILLQCYMIDRFFIMVKKELWRKLFKNKY